MHHVLLEPIAGLSRNSRHSNLRCSSRIGQISLLPHYEFQTEVCKYMLSLRSFASRWRRSIVAQPIAVVEGKRLQNSIYSNRATISKVK